MLNNLKSTIAFSKVQSVVWSAESKVKDAAKAAKKPENIKTAAKVACVAATITSGVNAGAAVGKMVVEGVSKKAATSAAVHSLKAVAFGNLYGEINKYNNSETKENTKERK